MSRSPSLTASLSGVSPFLVTAPIVVRVVEVYVIIIMCSDICSVQINSVIIIIPLYSLAGYFRMVDLFAFLCINHDHWSIPYNYYKAAQWVAS